MSKNILAATTCRPQLKTQMNLPSQLLTQPLLDSLDTQSPLRNFIKILNIVYIHQTNLLNLQKPTITPFVSRERPNTTASSHDDNHILNLTS